MKCSMSLHSVSKLLDLVLKVSRKSHFRHKAKIMKVNALKSKAFVRNSVYRAKQYGVEFSADFDGEDIIRRDGQNCYLCERNLAIKQIQFEHVIPPSLAYQKSLSLHQRYISERDTYRDAEP